MPAQAIMLAGVQLGQDSHARHISGDDVHHRRLDFAGGSTGCTDQAHQAGIGLEYTVDTGAICVGPLLAIRRNRAVDQVRLERRQGIMAQAQPGHHPWAHAFDQHVGV
ncbi:hypothetical protein D9M71_153380 [compost metagenome]